MSRTQKRVSRRELGRRSSQREASLARRRFLEAKDRYDQTGVGVFELQSFDQIIG